MKPFLKTTILRFDSKLVVQKVKPAVRRYLRRSGSVGRLIMRGLLKPARRKRASELTEKEKETYDRLVDRAKEKGLPKPKRPLKPSDPEESPRLTQKPSPLKELIFFGIDLSSESVAIGFGRFGTNVIEVLEKGGISNGRKIEPRPTVKPALEQLLPQLPGFLKDSVTR